ncbi:uncharacterized protein LOC141899492 [Tubulanus polymorphus]|uniref:uncharacterized protein LOC141899492 n=1 Tax=Tubulanus polymorphus TaxID=672921 RepID=UPI003DA5020A
MELSEVVSAQFAFPVCGVLLCAVLVFAFGFKSSVQPPSFDFEDESEKRQKKLKKSKKSSSSVNGHVSSNNTHTTSNKAAPKKVVGSPSQKTKTKKSTTQRATNVKSEVAIETSSPIDNNGNDGEWTTALSKKEKKLRSKEKRDETMPEDTDAVIEEATAAIESPKNQAKKEKIIKKSPKDEKKEETVEEAPVTKIVEEKEEVVPETVKPMSKKNIKKKEKKVQEEPKQIETSNDKPTELSPTLADIASPKTDEIEKVDKVEKSPKKKKKQPSTEVEVETSITKDTKTSSHISNTTKEQLQKPLELKDASEKPNAQSLSNGVSDVPKPAAVFDEMGDDSWSKAKPPHKKKKARRDN